MLYNLKWAFILAGFCWMIGAFTIPADSVFSDINYSIQMATSSILFVAAGVMMFLQEILESLKK